MDLQKQQTGLSSTTNPQAIPQVPLSAGTSNLQQNTGTSSTNISQLKTTTLTVTSSCTTNCTGSIPAQNSSSNKAASGTWVAVGLVLLVVVVTVWIFRRPTKSNKKSK